MSMQIMIKYFSLIAEITKKKEELFSFDEPLTVNELFIFLNKQYKLTEHRDYLRFAVNFEYVKSDFVLNDNDEVALITPVAGG